VKEQYKRAGLSLRLCQEEKAVQLAKATMDARCEKIDEDLKAGKGISGYSSSAIGAQTDGADSNAVEREKDGEFFDNGDRRDVEELAEQNK
jgi:hypothetical protein